MVPNSAKAATCLDVFPSAINDSLLGSGNELINIPPFTGADWYMDSVQTIPLGDSQHMAWYSQQTVIVNPAPVSETSARLYISGGANWVNAKINVGGNPEDLIIVISGSLGISGGQTEINAIIYSRSSITVSGNVTINGAIAAEGSISTTPSVNINYDQNAIVNSDFNGMCGNVVPIANYQFDECTYTGAAFEIIDHTGLYPATAFGSVDTNSTGQIERFVDISSENHHLETSIPLPANFSISTWFKKPSSNSDSPYFALGAMQNGGDLLYVDRSNNWRWGVYNPNTGTSNGTFSFATLDNNWHHMAVVYSDGGTQLYIDGMLTDAVNTVPAGTLKYIATSFDDVNGSNPQGFRAPLDEFLVYDIALSAADILTIYDNQVVGSNYDGTARTPVFCSVSAILDYRFDECSYDGTTGEVIDQLGNYHGTTTGVPDTISDARINQAVDLTATGTSDWIDVPKAAVDGLDDFSLSVWVNTTVSKNTQTIFHALGSSTTDDEVQLSLKDSNRVKFEVRNQNRGLTSAINLIDGAWHHIVVTRVGTTVCLYVDGSQQHCKTNSKSGALEVNNNAVVIGQRQRAYGGNFTSLRSFEGKLDEFKIYDVKLEATDINTIYQNELAAKNYDGTDRALVECNTYVDHFRLDTLDQQGLTCEADEITITACADATCSAEVTDPYDVELLVNGVSNHTITVTGGSVTTSYIHTSVGNAALSLAQHYQCTNSNNTPCNVDFRDAGFVFSGIGDQVAGVDFSGINIRAVKDSNGVCIDLLSGSKSVDMAMEYRAPDRTTTNKYYLSGTAIEKNLLGSVNSYTTIALDFVADAVAAVADLGINKYDDAGQVKLYARYVEPASGGNPSFTIEGSSSTFWVSPHHFSVVAKNGNIILDNTTTTTPTIKKQIAGDAFTLSFTAENADGDATTNYIAQQAQLQLERTGPTSGNAEGTLKYSNTKSITSKLITAPLVYMDAEVIFDLNGKYEFSEATYSEVGLTKLYIRDNNYGSGVYKAEGIANVGRFTPAYFIQTVKEHGTLNANHSDTCQMDWAYAGQTLDRSGVEVGAISYAAAPIIKITAFNLDGVITQNYTETGFMKLSASGITIPLPIVDNAMDRLFPDPNIVDEKVHISSNMSAGDDPIASDNKGVVTYTFNQLDHFVYEHSKHSKLKAFDAAIPFIVTKVEDADLINLSTAANSTAKVITTDVEIRFGRWLLENSYGPETSALPVTMFTQYFNGDNFDDTDFINNANENCLVPEIGDIENTGNIGEGGMDLWKYRLADLDGSDTLLPEDIEPGFEDEDKSFVSGLYRWLLFSTPGAGNIGSLKVEYQVPPWLQYDWNSDDSFTDNPTATLTFGIYRGNDRIIYQREIEK